MSRLYKACVADDHKAVKYYITAKWTDIDECFKVAFKKQNIRILKLLLKHKIDNDLLNEALYKACVNKNANMVKLLSKKHALDDQADCLMLACSNNSIDIVNTLIDYNNYGSKLRYGFSFSCKAGNVELSQLLINKGAEVDEYIFNRVIMCGNLQMVKLLVNYLHDYDYIDGAKVAYTHHQPKILQFILTETPINVNKFIEWVYDKRAPMYMMRERGKIDNVDKVMIACMLNNNVDYKQHISEHKHLRIEKFIHQINNTHIEYTKNIQKILNKFNIHNYDTNISKMITEYLPYKLSNVNLHHTT